MAVMSENDRQACFQEFMAEMSAARESAGSVVKADVKAASDALDQWLSDNAATINAALPQPFRGAATQEIKARLFIAVVRKRYIVGA